MERGIWQYFMGSDLDLINSKIRKYKLLRFLNIFLASLFSLIGTVSIVYFLMFLNMFLRVGYFTCFVLAIALARFYSFVINNVVLIKIENKINNTLLDIVGMMEDYKCNVNLKSEVKNDCIEKRFQQLSLRNQLELLTYIKNGITIDDRCDRFLSTSLEDGYNEENSDAISIGNGYTRSRNIETERGKKYH